MPLSPRTLRPANTFTPRSISGLALWLDASASGDLYTTDAGPVVPVSSPTEIAGCALWLDGADSSAASMTLNGSLVETWKDKSGNNRNATASGTARPTLTGSALNGRSVVTFDGTANQMQIDGTFLVTSNATIFAVARRTSGGFGAVITSKGTGDTSPSLQHASGSWQINHAGNLSVIGAQAGYAVLSGTISAGATAAFANGLLQDSDASSGSLASDATKTYIGTYRAAIANVLAGEIAEIIVYNTALSTADRARVEAYLAQRWGITGVHAAATSASDPVGYWRDRSGNGRHAVQATGANRPTLSVAARNSRNAINITGGASHLLAPINLSQPNSYAFVYRTQASAGVSSALFDGTVTRQNMNVGTFSAGTDLTIFAGTANRSIGGALGTSQWRLAYVGLDGANSVGSVDSPSTGTLIGNPGTNGIGTGIRIGTRTDSAGGFTGPIAEFLMFSRALTSSEWARLARYLAAKWGIVLAPQVSNADAQNWIDRVYANGGTVTASTAAAVNQFCNDIENAPGGSIRDRFYRLNLFCGTGLNACLVPLYRGQSLGGAQFGNTIDTNNGPFVEGNYVETGATGGLWYGGVGTNSSKYLNTGLPQSTISLTNLHLSASLRDGETTYSGESTLIGHYNSTQADFVSLRQAVTTGAREFLAGSFGASIASAAASSTEPHVMGVRSGLTATNLYRAGVSVASSAVSVGSVSTSALPYFVFARNNSGTPNNYTSARLRMYSIGTAMDGTAALAFANAVAAFNTAMGRA